MNYEIERFIDDVVPKLPAIEGCSCVIYTALFGAYDELKDPLVVDQSAYYLCFTDNRELKSDVWNIVVLATDKLDPRKSARALKMLPHRIFPHIGLSLWVDAKCLVVEHTRPLVDALDTEKVNFACFPHSVRSRVRSEALACMIRGYDSPFKIAKQWLRYRMEGFRDDTHLIESTVLVRRHNEPDVVAFQTAWLQEVLRRSIRDQLSFNYTAFRERFLYYLYEEPLTRYFDVKPHRTIGCYGDDTRLKIPIQRKIINFLLRK
jgi:hypothetical protein